MNSVELPYVRDEIISAVQSLASASLQGRWGVVEEGVNYYDDLDLVTQVAQARPENAYLNMSVVTPITSETGQLTS